MKKTRLDILIVERGLAESRSQAQRMIMAGQVRLNGQLAQKPGDMVDAGLSVELVQQPAFVSRGGEKLDAALQAFSVQVSGLVCADVGASTGGFTDCLLQHGAAKVYAIDVGRGILDWKLRSDPRVVVMEGTNARSLTALPAPVHLVTIDASFISLKLLLPVVKGWFPQARPGDAQSELGRAIALIKPQFEAGRKEAARGKGVIRDPAVHRRVLLDVLEFAQREDFGVRGLIVSPLLGPKGNTEFLADFRWLGEAANVEGLVAPLLVGPLTVA